MTILTGKGIYGGYTVGSAVFFRRHRSTVTDKSTINDVEGEIERFHLARMRAIKDLKELYDEALQRIGESGAQIFEIHSMMLEDADYLSSVEKTIRIDKTNAEYAVKLASDHFSAVFSSMEDPYMSARAADIRDISNRLIRILRGDTKENEENSTETEEKMILCADDLSPSEAMQIDKSRVLAFVTAGGSVNSHTAILSRAMGIPAVVSVGEELMSLSDGGTIGVDAYSGKVYLAPDAATAEALREKEQKDIRSKALLQKYKGLDNVTKDGYRIELFANIQSISEVGAALSNDAGGIGLFRSEFLYLDRSAPPDEEEQFRAYRTVLQSMGDKKVVIRTLDIGADKQVDYLGLAKEENSAMGLRAIRICLTKPELFRTQLRALFRASVFGRLSIMFPMITSVAEVNEIRTFCMRIQEELRREGYAIAPKIEIGIMIETPAAALISDRLAPLVDFFSVGTNDLTQYTLALDRQNPAVTRFFDPHHEAILRLIRYAAESAHKYGKWIGICGELGADTALTEEFLRMGIDELSVSPSYILVLRDKIRNTDLSNLSNTMIGGNHGLQ